MVSVHADVAERAAGAGERGVGTPFGVAVTGGLDGRRQPVLKELDLNHADGPKLARRHHGPRLAHHGIAREGVDDAEDEAALPHAADQVGGVGQRRRHRLLADHVDAAVEEGAGDGVVGVIGRDDADDVDAVLARGLGLGHMGIARVGALGRDQPLGRRFLGGIRAR